MNKKWMLPVGLALLVGWMGAGSPAGAQEVAQEEVRELAMVAPASQTVMAGANLRATPKRLTAYAIPGLEKPVNLDTFAPMSVEELIGFLALRGGMNNIIMGRGVGGQATKLKFSDVTVGEALEVILSVNNLAFEVEGGIITIVTDEEYRLKHGVSFYDNKQVRIVDLQYTEAGRVAGMLAAIKSDIGTVVADALTGTLVLIDTPAKIDEMLAVIKRADIPTVERIVPTETRSFVLKYAEVADLESRVAGLLSPDIGSLQADVRTKTLLVSDLPHRMARIARMIEIFDAKPRQVFIEAKILEIRLSDDYQLGVNWSAVFDGMDPRFRLSGLVRRPGLGPDNPGIGALGYKTVLGDSGMMSLMVEALKNVGKTEILSNPHVSVLDGEEAVIKAVQQLPYAETSLEITGSETNFAGENIKFIEVGVILSVTPRISDDGFISMSLRPEISSASYDYQAFRQIPVVTTTYTETMVSVRDGETLVIAGMIENQKVNASRAVPYFGKIPLLGVLFRSTQDRYDKREVVMFMTPRIITGNEGELRSEYAKKKAKPLRVIGTPTTTTDAGKTLKPVR